MRLYGSHNGGAVENRKVKLIYGLHSVNAIPVMDMKHSMALAHLADVGIFRRRFTQYAERSNQRWLVRSASFSDRNRSNEYLRLPSAHPPAMIHPTFRLHPCSPAPRHSAFEHAPPPPEFRLGSAHLWRPAGSRPVLRESDPRVRRPASA